MAIETHHYTTNNGNSSGPTGTDIDLPLAVNSRWVALDLDVLREQLISIGLPVELICTYVDASGRRRYIERGPARKPINHRRTAA